MSLKKFTILAIPGIVIYTFFWFYTGGLIYLGTQTTTIGDFTSIGEPELGVVTAYDQRWRLLTTIVEKRYFNGEHYISLIVSRDLFLLNLNSGEKINLRDKIFVANKSGFNRINNIYGDFNLVVEDSKLILKINYDYAGSRRIDMAKYRFSDCNYLDQHGIYRPAYLDISYIETPLPSLPKVTFLAEYDPQKKLFRADKTKNISTPNRVDLLNCSY